MARISMATALHGVKLYPSITRPRKIANNTFEYVNASGNRTIRLHYTDILEFLPDHRIRLNSGGWRTVTTKERLSKYLRPLGYTVYSVDGIWHISNAGISGSWKWDSALVIPFEDGMILPDDFQTPAADNAAKIAKQVKLSKSICAFVRKLDGLDKLPEPNAGDCWICMTQREPANAERKSGGWAPEHGNSGRSEDTEHLLSHIAEGYMHGTLLVNAMRWAGYRDQTIGLHFQGFGSRTTLKSALRRYLRRKLGLST